MELIKDSNASNTIYENENPNQPVPLQQLFGLTPSSTTSSITPNISDISKSLLSMFNNAPQTSSVLPLPLTTVTTTKNCSNAASNDDSLDSTSGACNGSDKSDSQKKTRRRKQQKTIRLANDKTSSHVNVDTSVKSFNNDNNSSSGKDESSKDMKTNLNGLDFSNFNTNVNNTLSTKATNSILQQPPPASSSSSSSSLPPPQTQSIDLSQHCAGHDTFENGLLGFSKLNDLAKPMNEKNGNHLRNDEINGINLFSSMNYLRGSSSITNDISTFPNTDDLVKKVEELVKCNERNGFGEPIELIKSHNNKSNTDIHNENNVSNSNDAMAAATVTKIKLDEQVNDLTTSVNFNGNGTVPVTRKTNLDDQIDGNVQENGSDEPILPLAEAKIPESLPFTNSTPKTDNKLNTTADANADKILSDSDDKQVSSNNNNNNNNNSNNGNQSASISSSETNNERRQPTDDDGNEQSNANSTNDDKCNESQDNINEKITTTTITTNETNKECRTTSAPSSSSESNSSNQNIRKKPIVNNKRSNSLRNKTKTNNKSNGKLNKRNAGKKNRKTFKLIEKIEKSDIKKTKSKDESSNDALAKFRGPYVRIEQNGTQCVINTPLTEEIAEKQNKFKKNFVSQSASERNKIRGLHVSTLSNKYDADTRDVSWMCVFCKLGPHKYGLGDLFGPFILSTDSEEHQLAQIDPNDDLFRGQRTKADMTSKLLTTAAKNKATNAANVSSKKKKYSFTPLKWPNF